MVYVLWSSCKTSCLDLTALSTLRASIPRRVSFHCVVLLLDALTCKSIKFQNIDFAISGMIIVHSRDSRQVSTAAGVCTI